MTDYTDAQKLAAMELLIGTSDLVTAVARRFFVSAI